MATKKTAQQQQYEAVMAELRAKQYKPVYLLMGTSVGTESYYLDSISDYVLQNVLKEEEKDFNQSLFYGSDTSMKQVVEQCKRYPMMAERQVVVFREAQQTKDFDLLEKYVANPNPSTLLVICYKGSVDGRKNTSGNYRKSDASLRSLRCAIGNCLLSSRNMFGRKVRALMSRQAQ